MGRKRELLAILCLASAILIACMPIGLAAVSAGVKKGDWMEYIVAATGTATEGHDIVWARMELTNVQGTTLNVTIETRDSSGKQDIDDVTLDLEKGKLGDQFIIPANLNVGDVFVDETYGNVTISGSEDRLVAGAERVTLYENLTDRSVYWDKATGVLVEGRVTTAGFTMDTKLNTTNLWQSQTLLSQNTLYMLVGITVTLLGIVLVVFAIYFKRKNRSIMPKT